MTAIVVQSSSPSSIQCGSPTPNDELRQNLHLGNSRFDPPTSSLSTLALHPLESDTQQQQQQQQRQQQQQEEQERDRNCRREKEEEEDQLSVLALFVSAFRNSLVRCYNKVEEGSVSSSWAKKMEIGLPTNVRHVAHVTFDRFSGFLGLPVEFEPEVPSRAPSASTTVFGVSTNSMQLSFDSRGNSVPSILLRMQRRLYALRGLEVEGIFRINAGNDQEEYVRDQLNRGVVPDDADVHCLAGLIKAWFRELPTGLLDSLSPEQLIESQTEEEHVQLARTLPLTEAFLLDWAVNLMADIAQHEHLNKMKPRNVAVVFAPNMTHVLDPLTALMHAVQVMNFLKTLILRRLREREDVFLDAPLPVNEPSDENTPPSLLQTAVERSGEWFDAQNELMTHKPGSEKHILAHLLAQDEISKDGDEADCEGPGFFNSIENIIVSGSDDNASSSRGARNLRDQLIKSRLDKAQRNDTNEPVEKNKGANIVSRINPQSERIEAWR